jgi:hypothetical protein
LEQHRDVKQRRAEATSSDTPSSATDGRTTVDLSDFELPSALDDKTTKALLKDMTKLLSIDGYHWRAIVRLCRRAYWARLWIWQEVIASRFDPIVVCGDTVFVWADLCLASHYLLVFGATILRQTGRSKFYVDEQGQTSPQNQPHRIANTRLQYMKPGKGAKMMRKNFGRLVLEGNRNDFECTDERDRLFAHVGLCKYDKLTAAEYEKPFWQLYRDFWADIIARPGCVNLLTYVEDASMRLNRPRKCAMTATKTQPKQCET